MQEYTVGENQHKNYFFLIETAGNQYIRLHVERNANLVVEILIASTAHVHLECILLGAGAHVSISGAYILDAAHKVQITTVQHHRAAHTSSTLIMKGLLRDSAQAQYHGTVRIEKDAQGSCASQENKNILLSNQARAVSVPNLEVLTHDVQCAHGSAVGRFDAEQMFYAASRGIDETTAQRLLSHAFVANLFTDEMLKNKVIELL